MDDPQAAVVRRHVSEEPTSEHDGDATVGFLQRLCRVVVHHVPVDAAGMTLADGDGRLLTAATSGPVGAAMLDLQFILGEGPGLTAFDQQRPVLVPDLVRMGGTWPAYVPAAQDHEVEAVFAFPLQLGVARLGVMDLYRHQVGELSARELSWAQTYADVATEELLDPRTRHDVAQTEGGAGGPGGPGDLRFEVYQAQGMVMIQLGVPAETALLRLRAHAFATDRPLADVARDVIERRLLLPDEGI